MSVSAVNYHAGNPPATASENSQNSRIAASELPKSELIALALALADALDASAARLRAKSAAGRARAADLRLRADELDRHALATLAAEGRPS